MLRIGGGEFSSVSGSSGNHTHDDEEITRFVLCVLLLLCGHELNSNIRTPDSDWGSAISMPEIKACCEMRI